MMTLWIAYSLIIGAWVYLAATAAERGSRALGMSTRWIWTTAGTAAVATPLFRLLGFGPVPQTVSSVEPAGLTGSIATAAELAGHPGLFMPETLAFLDRPLLAVWLVATMALGAWLLVLSVRLARECRTWPFRHVSGVRVRVAPDTGPAVIGVLRGTIVVPRWIDELPDEDQGAILHHEMEHLRRYDNAVILAALVAAVLMPWNLPLWGMLRRLRHAVEFDCDRRVVSAGIARRRYGELLLEVFQRRTQSRVLITALSPDASLLSRRIAMMQPTTPRFRSVRLAGSLAVAGLLAVAACETPTPPALSDAPNAVSEQSFGAVQPQLLSGAPLRYPEMLRQAGIEGEVVLDFQVREDGTVDEESISIVSSTNRAFEAPARHTIAESTFSPATVDGKPVTAQVQQLVEFRLQGSASGSPEAAAPADTDLVFVAEESDRPIKVFVDGEQVAGLVTRLPAVTKTALEGLNPDDIERIEVIKGAPAVGRFGEDAAGGVIQIYLKKKDSSGN